MHFHNHTIKMQFITTGKQWQFIYNLDDHMAVVHKLVVHKHSVQQIHMLINKAEMVTLNLQCTEAMSKLLTHQWVSESQHKASNGPNRSSPAVDEGLDQWVILCDWRGITWVTTFNFLRCFNTVG